MSDKMKGRKTYLGMTFEAVLRKFADTINRACLVHCADEEDAKDCFQNTFLKLYLSDTQFESTEHLKAWLLKVALNECADVYRQNWKKRISLSDDMNSVLLKQNIYKKDVYSSEDGMLELVLKMHEKYRQVIYLYYYEGYSIEEIAGILGQPVNTIKTRMARGRKKLGETYQKEVREYMA